MPPLASSASVIWSWRSRAVWGLVLVVEALETGILGGLAIVFVVGLGGSWSVVDAMPLLLEGLVGERGDDCW